MTDASQEVPTAGGRPGLYLIALVLIAGGFFAFSLNTQLNPDGILYFSYVRSAFFDRDILLVNEFNSLRLLPLSRHLSATGLESSQVAIGTPLLMAPFYAIAFLLDHFLGLFGLSAGDDGYRGVYACVFPFGSFVYGCLTGLMILGIVRKRFRQQYAAVSLLHIVVGTPFLFYMAVHYHISHLCSAFSVTLFLYAFETTRDDPGLTDRYAPFFVLGALSGVAILVRTQNGLFWVIPFCFLLLRLWHTRELPRVLCQGVSFLAGAVIAASPQLTLWKILHGRWLHAPEAANINFFQPHLLEVLTSTYHGLLVWSPILILSFIGLFLLVRHDPGRGLPLLLAVLLQLAVNGSMRMWWEGASFGLRLFVNCTPIFCIGLAFAYTRVRAAWIRWLGGLFAFWTFLLSLNAVTYHIDLNQFYSLPELFLLQTRQLTGLLRLDAYSGVIRSVGGAVMLTAVVILTMTVLIRIGRYFQVKAGGLFAMRGVLATLLAGFGISGLIWLLGAAGHQHKEFWQDDLKRIESGLNSYSLFYIDYSFYITHAEYLASLGRLAEAVDEYKKAIAIYPTPTLYRRLVEILAADGRYRESGETMQQALARWPDNPELSDRVRRIQSQQ